MSFDEALKFLKHGVRMSRKAWNGSGMYIFYQKPIDPNFHPCFIFKTEQAKFTPWFVPHADILADDWVIFREL